MTEETNPALFTFVKLTVRDIDAMTAFFIDGFGMAHADTVDTPEFREHMLTGKKGSATVVLFPLEGRARDRDRKWLGPAGHDYPRC